MTSRLAPLSESTQAVERLNQTLASLSLTEEEQGEVELELDLFTALAVLEKLELHFAKYHIQDDEYRDLLPHAINKCIDQHYSLKQRYPTIKDFVSEYRAKGSSWSFSRALARIDNPEGSVQIPKKREFNPRDIGNIISHIVGVQQILQLDTLDSDPDKIEVAALDGEFRVLIESLKPCHHLVHDMESYNVLQEWNFRIRKSASSTVLDARKLMGDLNEFFTNFQTLLSDLGPIGTTK